jgi:tetratricopeptide (TPR) repeat protein
MMAVEFDEEELLHLALRASADQRHDEAMGYLKSATQRFPMNAKARYLLGAEHAHIGMYDRAIVDIGEAIRLDPSLIAAHFQLGLLHLTSGTPLEAERAWEALDGLAPTEPLYLFKVGLTHLIHDRLKECAAALEQGIARNATLPPLNVDMQRVLDEVRARLASGMSMPREKPGVAPPGDHALLSAYRQNSDEPTKGST